MSHRKFVWSACFIGLVLAISGLVIAEKPLFQKLSSQNPINPDELSGDYQPQEEVGGFLGQAVTSDYVTTPVPQAVLGLSDEPKHIEVDLSRQRLYAFEGDTKVYEFPVSTGKWAPTPTGTFRIWGKFKYTKMSGGSQLFGTYYYLPNVPFVMFFANSKVAASRGFSLHGTYWHNNFGHPMSHGCVNMRTQDAGTIFYWSQPAAGDGNSARSSADDPGTEVIIYGVTPDE